MPPRRNNKQQAKIACEVIETKINNFVSKSTDDNSSDDSGDEVNIYVESMRKSKIPIVPPTGLVEEARPATSGEPIKKIRVRPSRAKPKPNVENVSDKSATMSLSHPPPHAEAVDYFKLLEQYKVELNQTKKELEDVKNRPPIPTVERVPEKKSDLDIRREMFKLRFQ